MKRHSKRYRLTLGIVNPSKPLPLKEAIGLLKKAPPARFDESVDISVALGINLQELQAPVRGTVQLPHGTGKTVKVIVFCRGEAERSAREAGADAVGSTELIEKISGGWLGFDVTIATPDMMKEVSKLGKILGPRGLMPNPKAGTVTEDVAKAVKDAKRGKIEFKMDKLGCVNLSVGRISFQDDDLYENAQAFFDALQRARPATAKGVFIKGTTISTTMGPGIRLDAGSAQG